MDRENDFSPFLKSRYNSFNNSSFSFTKIVCEQTFESDNFIQKYSCEQIFDKSNQSICSVKEEFQYYPKQNQNVCLNNAMSLNNNSWGLGGSQLSSQFTQLSLSDNKPSFPRQNFSEQFIPVNKNFHNCKKTDEHLNSELAEKSFDDRKDFESLKNRLKNLEGTKAQVQQPRDQKPKDLKMKLLIIVLLLVVFSAACSAFFSLPSIAVNFLKRSGYCHNSFKARFIPMKLRQQLHGQEAAVHTLSSIFDNIDRSDGIVVLSFIGGIGVGKTHSSEIIKKELKKQKYNIVDVFSHQYRNSDEVYKSLSRCSCNLLRIDNLKSENIEMAANFIFDITFRVKSVGYKPCLIIISIFNTEDVDNNLNRHIDLDKSIEMIDANFKNHDFDYTIVPFHRMSNEALVKCIKEAALFANVELTAEIIDKVKEELVSANSGCKGAYAKVQLVGKPRGKPKPERQKTEL